jgi:hypothetical protein
MSKEDVKVYDLTEVTVNFLGVPLDELGGWGDGGGCEIEFEGDSFEDKRGADGTVVRSKTYEDRATVKLILMQTAAANAVLSGILAVDRKASNGAGVGPILIRDRQGLTVVTGSKAWIKGRPKTVNFKGSAENLEWLIRVADTEDFIGGN